MKDYSFANRIFSLRTAKHLSQKELGEVLGVSDKAVSRWENGSSKPRTNLLPKLASALGVTPDELFGSKNEIFDGANIAASGTGAEEKIELRPSADTVKVNFIPETAGFNGNYLCTWSLQQSAAGKLNIGGNNIPEKQRNALSEETLFCEELYHPYEKSLRQGLIFLIDDGWDVPFNTDSTKGTDSFGLCEPDKEKFSAFGSNGEERLKNISKKIKEMGYFGLGLWISPQRSGTPSLSETEKDRAYWEEKATLSQKAGVVYWKVDWGKASNMPGYREMMTQCVRKCAPGLLIEHIVSFLPFTGDSVKAESKSAREAAKRWEFSDYFRTYDVKKPFDDTETFGRIDALLKNIDKNGLKYHSKGFINVESQPMVAAGLSLNVGIMEKSAENAALLRWQRISPAFSANEGKYLVSDERVCESLRFDCDPAWWLKKQWEYFSFDIPMVASRGTALPKVSTDGIKPVILVSANKKSNTLAVSSLLRTVDPNKKIIAPACVTVYPQNSKTTVGVFGYYKSLSLQFKEDLPKNIQVWAQCLLDDNAVNVTKEVKISGNTVTLDGLLLRKLGHSIKERSKEHQPVLLIKIL